MRLIAASGLALLGLTGLLLALDAGGLVHLEPGQWKVAVAVLVGLALAVASLVNMLGFGSSSAKASGQPTVLLLGPSGAGKTSLFLRWEAVDLQEAKDTVTSIAPNEAPSFSLAPLHRLIDCPGHHKLVHFVRDYLSKANVKAVLFMVDAAAGLDGVKASAKPLFSVLEVTESRLIPVLIAANKYDLFSALSVARIQSTLETELNELRDTQSLTVPSSEEDTNWNDGEREFLGVDGKRFEFADLESAVTVLDGSVRAGRLGKWENWIEETLV